MAAFRGAVEVGAHGLETDLHLSADGVAVISHVSSLPHHVCDTLLKPIFPRIPL